MRVSKPNRKPAFFEMPKTFIIRWVVRYVGRLLGADKKGSSIFLKFAYINTQDMKIQNVE